MLQRPNDVTLSYTLIYINIIKVDNVNIAHDDHFKNNFPGENYFLIYYSPQKFAIEKDFFQQVDGHKSKHEITILCYTKLSCFEELNSIHVYVS